MSDHVEALRSMCLPKAAGSRTLRSVPGCWDGLSALLIEQAGFEAAFVSGGAVAMARLGRPDLGLTTASEAAEVIAAVRDRVSIPLIADGDTGFGNALNLQRTVRSFERAGASAIQIEDQHFPKRCGHMAGKSVVPLDTAVGRVKAALDARLSMLVVARTDAVAVEGLEAALERAEAFLSAGADLIFVEGPRDATELDAVAKRFAERVPLVDNLVEGGINAVTSGIELERLGFAIALHPLMLLHGFVANAPGWLAALRKHRSTDPIAAEIVNLAAMNALTGSAEMLELERRYHG